MENSAMEIIKDLLMYLSGSIDAAGDSPLAANLSYVRMHLKNIYDGAQQGFKDISVKENNILGLVPGLISEIFFDNIRIINCLVDEKIFTIDRLLQLSERDLLKIPNFGPTSLRILKERLADYGLKLSSTDLPWEKRRDW